MKLLIAHNFYRSDFLGGEDLVFNNELRGLSEYLGKENVFSYTVHNDDINKLTLPVSIWHNFIHENKIYNVVKENNIKFLHVHNFFPMLTPAIFRAAKKAGAITICTLHNFRFWCPSGTLYRDNAGICELCPQLGHNLNAVKYKCFRNSRTQSVLASTALSFYKFLNYDRYIDKYFVLTNFQKHKLLELKLPEEKIIIKPNFIENHPVNLSTVFKSDFIFVGRLEEDKGIYALLNCWKKLDKRFKLKIIGQGRDSDLKTKYQGENIEFLGQRSHEETIKKISNARYLIQPSLWYETFGLTILEAMSVGTPVIGFDIGTRKDFIRHKENGFITNPENLNKTLQEAFSYDSYSTLSLNAINTAKDYSKDKILEKQIEIYKNLLNQ